MKTAVLGVWHRIHQTPGGWQWMSYGDRKHWQASIGRLGIERWCSVRHCGPHPHWVRLKIWRRSGSIRFDT